MKFNLRTLRRRLYGIALLGDKVRRARYFRGHGVHSPFVYGLVRNVFMCRSLQNEAFAALRDELCKRGIAERRSVQIANAAAYCEAEGWAVDSLDTDYVVLTPAYPTDRLKEAYEWAKTSGATVVIVAPYANRERMTACHAITASHRSTVVDNRAYLMIFNNRLPKQHFRL